MKVAGCYLSIGHDGKPSVKRGLVRKQDWKKVAKENPAEETEKTSPSEPSGGQLSAALRRDLEAYRLEVAKVAIADRPEIALDLLVFRVASELLSFSPPKDGPDVRFNRTTSTPSGEGKTVAAAQFEVIEKKLPTAWLKAKNEAQRFEEFRKLKLPQKLALLAFSTASTLKATLASDDPKQVTAYEVALSLTGASVFDSWRPTRESYLGRVTREQLLALGRDLFGESWVHSRRSEKKGKLVDELHKAFSNPKGRTAQPDEFQRLRQWLPAGMAFQGSFRPNRPARRRKGR
jgi:ParB family chromosome partitioning protein